MKYNRIAHIIGAVARTLLGLTFLFSGFVKAVDPLGTTYKIEDYLHAFGGFFMQLDALANGAAIVLIAFEFLLGFCLLFNFRTRLTSWLALVMMLFMTPLTLYIAITNPVSDCGCFGDAIVLSNWATFWKNIVLLALVIVLLCTRKYIPQLFTWKAELGVFSLGVLALVTIMLVSSCSLPFIDFRPYKIGNHIPTLMEGADAPIHDFSIETYEDGYDLTEDILISAEPITLVIMYDLKKADVKQMAKVEELYQNVSSYNTTFLPSNIYILTGSTRDEVSAFCAQHFNDPSIEFVFCATDPVTLKTIVRANPGVIVVQDGVIIDKYNLRNK